MDQKKRLGRGLDALLGADTIDVGEEVAVDLLDANPRQPRKNYDTDDIRALSASVKTLGILQPIVVRHIGERYQIVAGERRRRAAQECGLKTVPVRVVELSDREAYEATLVENIQRTDLNPIEKALGFQSYCREYNISHDVLAQRLGVARSTITNLLALLDLPQEVQEGLRSNQITEGHAKLLKGVRGKDRQIAIFKQIVAMGLSVKAAESLVREEKSGEPADSPEATESEPALRKAPAHVEKTAHLKGIEDELRKKLATRVDIRLRAKDRGAIVLEFENNDDFERLMEVLRK